jgi:MFS family permease
MTVKKRKSCLSHHAIFILLCLAAFTHNILMNGAMNVVLSSLQKEFYLSSRDIGIYISVYDIGSLVSSCFVPILGSRGSKPRWIAFGMFMLCLGCLVNVTSHFLKPQSSTDMTYNETMSNPLMSHDAGHLELCTQDKNHDGSCSNQMRQTDGSSSFRLNNLKYILFASNILNGLSSSSIVTLAFSYIADIAPPGLSTIYESIYYAVQALGMVISFFVWSNI